MPALRPQSQSNSGLLEICVLSDRLIHKICPISSTFKSLSPLGYRPVREVWSGSAPPPVANQKTPTVCDAIGTKR